MTDELFDLEKKLDALKHVYSTSSKKIANSLQSNPGDSDDKRRKKLPEYALGNTFRELVQTVPPELATSIVLNSCGDSLTHMADDIIEYQKMVEAQVIDTFNVLVDVSSFFTAARLHYFVLSVL